MNISKYHSSTSCSVVFITSVSTIYNHIPKCCSNGLVLQTERDMITRQRLIQLQPSQLNPLGSTCFPVHPSQLFIPKSASFPNNLNCRSSIRTFANYKLDMLTECQLCIRTKIHHIVSKIANSTFIDMMFPLVFRW